MARAAKGWSGIGARAGYGAMAGALAAGCMTVMRMAARRRGVIEKSVPQAAEEWLAARAQVGRGAHPALHHLADQLLHLGYGAVLGGAYGLTVRGRTRTALARGAGFGLATWLLGSWVLLPMLRAEQAPWRKRPPENAIDALAHLVYGAATAIVVEELVAQPNRGPTSDARRRASRVG